MRAALATSTMAAAVACGQLAPQNTVANGASAAATSAKRPAAGPTKASSRYLGHWTGVEGMFLDMGPTDRADRFRLTMQYDLDHRRTVEARLDGIGLAFERDGMPRRLVPSDGASTGLKYLAGKKDCLTAGPGEGYCRD